MQNGSFASATVAHNDAHATYIVELAMSIAYNQNDIFLIITENKGIVPNLSEGMMLEVACRVGINGQSRFASRKQVPLRRGCWKDSMRMKN